MSDPQSDRRRAHETDSDAERDARAGGGDEDPMKRADAANGEPDATEERSTDRP